MTDLHEMLLKVRQGEISLAEAESYLRRKPFEDMGYAKVDTHRRVRSGFPEVIFAQGKADEHLLAIFQRIFADEGEVMATRASEQQYELIAARLPEARYDKLSRIITCVRSARQKQGCIQQRTSCRSAACAPRAQVSSVISPTVWVR